MPKVITLYECQEMMRQSSDNPLVQNAWGSGHDEVPLNNLVALAVVRQLAQVLVS